MQFDDHFSNNEHLIPPSPKNDDNTFPSSPSENLESPLSDVQPKSLSSNKTSSISSHLEQMESLVFNTIINLLSPDQEASEAHYKARSRERHAQEFSDTANALRFVSLHRDRLRYIPQSNCWMLRRRMCRGKGWQGMGGGALEVAFMLCKK